MYLLELGPPSSNDFWFKVILAQPTMVVCSPYVWHVNAAMSQTNGGWIERQQDICILITIFRKKDRIIFPRETQTEKKDFVGMPKQPHACIVTKVYEYIFLS